MFWLTTYAGIISALVTGIVVGLILWRFQQSADKKRVAESTKDSIENELDLIVYEAKRILKIHRFDGKLTTSFPDASIICEKVRLINKKIKGITIDSDDVWITAKKTPNLFNAVENSARDFDLYISHEARVFNNKRKAIFTNDKNAHLYCSCKVMDWKEEDIIPHLGVGTSDNIPEWINDFFEQISMKDRFQELKKSFTESNKEYIAAVEALSKL
jgi:hypothetical protein